MVYGGLGVGLRGGHGNGAKTGSQASNEMQLLDGGEFFFNAVFLMPLPGLSGLCTCGL